MGAPTSPLVTNLIFQRADKRILAASKKMNVTYTRYADDLSFSCDSVASLHQTKRLIAVIIRQEGFKVNPKKTRLLHQADCQSVTGLVVNDKVNVLRTYRRTTRALCHRLDVLTKEHGDTNKALMAASEYHAMNTGQNDVRPPLSHLNFINGRQAFENGVRENSQSSKNHDE
jgi:retron-type reverse transcriptase